MKTWKKLAIYGVLTLLVLLLLARLAPADFSITKDILQGRAWIFKAVQTFPGGANLTGGRPNTQVVEVCKSGCKYTDPQLAVNAITDASATKPYTVLIFPGVYDVDRMVNKGAQTGTITVTNGNTAVVGVGTLFTTEFQVGDFIKLSAHADSAFSNITVITDNTHLTLASAGGAQGPLGGYLGANGSGAIEKGWDYCPGIDMTGAGTPDSGNCSAALGGRDYISLVGTDRRGTIITRSRAASATTSLIQGNSHTKIENITLDSPSTRTIHWDTPAPASLDLNRIDFLTTTVGVGSIISTGIVSSDSSAVKVSVTDCYFGEGISTFHGGACPANSLTTEVFLSGNVQNGFGTMYGFDLTGNDSDCKWEIVASASGQRYFNVDPSGGILLDMPSDPTAAQRVYVFTDGALRARSTLSTGGTYFYNAFIYPTTKPPSQAPSEGVVSGDLLVHSPTGLTVGSTTTANAQWPVVAVNQADSSGTAGWFPRLATGEYAAVFVQAATAVALGDILVTSTTAKDATVNNDQADVTRILGWAESTKSAGSRSLVNVRLNKAAGGVGNTFAELKTFSGGATASGGGAGGALTVSAGSAVGFEGQSGDTYQKRDADTGTLDTYKDGVLSEINRGTSKGFPPCPSPVEDMGLGICYDAVTGVHKLRNAAGVRDL